MAVPFEVQKKVIPLRTQTEEEVLRCARRYARMALFQVRIEDDNPHSDAGLVVHFCKADADISEKQLAECLLRQAKKLLLAMSMDEVEGKLQE